MGIAFLQLLLHVTWLAFWNYERLTFKYYSVLLEILFSGFLLLTTLILLPFIAVLASEGQLAVSFSPSDVTVEIGKEKEVKLQLRWEDSKFHQHKAIIHEHSLTQ